MKEILQKTVEQQLEEFNPNDYEDLCVEVTNLTPPPDKNAYYYDLPEETGVYDEIPAGANFRIQTPPVIPKKLVVTTKPPVGAPSISARSTTKPQEMVTEKKPSQPKKPPVTVKTKDGEEIDEELVSFIKAYTSADAIFSEEELPSFVDNGRFLHYSFAQFLIIRLHMCRINDVVHYYDCGLYRPLDNYFQGVIVAFLPALRKAQRMEVVDYIRVSTSIRPASLAPPNLIPFNTQIYDLNTETFMDYDPLHVFLNRFPFDYKPDAPIKPNVFQMLVNIADNDYDVLLLIFEAIGNCFYRVNSYRGAVMLYGRSGNNGKSTLLNMVARLMGKRNTSYLSLQDTAERFRLYDIYGKAVNIGDDIPNSFLADSSIFKKLVTGEQLMAEKKGQDPISFKPFAKLFFAMNELPIIRDKTKAFFSRILLIPLNHDFEADGSADHTLKDYNWSTSDMEYLLMLAMDGLKRLLRQDGFTKPQAVIDATAEYELENNPMAAFLSEQGSLDGTPVAKAYQDFVDWNYSAGHKCIISRPKFTREVRAETGLIIDIKRHPYFDGKIGRCFMSSNI